MISPQTPSRFKSSSGQHSTVIRQPRGCTKKTQAVQVTLAADNPHRCLAMFSYVSLPQFHLYLSICPRSKYRNVAKPIGDPPSSGFHL